MLHYVECLWTHPRGMVTSRNVALRVDMHMLRHDVSIAAVQNRESMALLLGR